MLTRPLHAPPHNDGLRTAERPVNVQGPASYFDWLASLRRGDTVQVKQSGGDVMPPAMVTNETPCYVFVGKLKFHRFDGWQVARQSSCVYRMKLRLVRNEMEFAP